MANENSDQQHLCWNCKTDIGFKHFCGSCIKIQPLPASQDFFTFFELPRKLALDGKKLEQKFYELSKQFHPDYFQNASPDERDMALERSSVLNKAYQTLRDPWARAEYALDLENYGCKAMDEKTSPELLAEMFDIQERIETLREARKSGAQGGKVTHIQRELESSKHDLKKNVQQAESELETVFQSWDNVTAAAERSKLAAGIRKLIHRRKYLNTAVQTVEQALEG